jgi:hypothetical protein
MRPTFSRESSVTILVIALLMSSSSLVHATSKLFSTDDPISAVLTAPFGTLFKQKKLEKRIYHNARLAYEVNGAKSPPIPLKVITRGHFRRLNCTNPPLMLNFKKKGNNGTLIEGQDKVKLVAPCKRSDSYQEFVALEYLAYQIYEVVSDHHFKTRLLDLGYVDTDKKRPPWKATTFLIEDVKDVASRAGMKEQNVVQPDRERFDRFQAALVEVFQFFIANTDYSTIGNTAGKNCCHNARLIAEPGEVNPLFPVPYDFDASGFVNPRYAAPPEHLPIRKITQRLFTGLCKEDKYFHAALDRFRERKTLVYSVITESGLLSESTEKRKLKFIDAFYEMIDDEKTVQKKILDKCRGDLV